MALLGLIPEGSGKGATLHLSAAEVQKEAQGRALMMIGGTISIIGGALVMSVNPAVKSEATGIWKEMPESVRKNKTLAIIGVGVGVAAFATWALRSKMLKRLEIL